MLKGYDALMNLVLDEGEELLRGELQPRSSPKRNETKRPAGHAGALGDTVSWTKETDEEMR